METDNNIQDTAGREETRGGRINSIGINEEVADSKNPKLSIDEFSSALNKSSVAAAGINN